MYISGIAEEAQDAGLMDDVQMALLATFSDLFVAPAEYAPIGIDGKWKPCVWSRLDDTGNAIIDAQFSRSIGTMRSRRAPHGMVT
jgi:hypothetical protein